MKTGLILLSASFVCILAACQAANPTIDAPLNSEFSLAPDQSATIRRTDLTITFNAVLNDDRCPRQIECAANGPVTVSLWLQEDNGTLSGISLQTFTDQEGRAPESQFEGIENSVETGDYVIRLVGVLPYPQNLSGIKPSDYQVTLIVTQK